MNTNTNSSVMLITGTSSGVGLSTAVAAAVAGYRVVATMRNPDKATALLAAADEAGIEVDVRALDVTDREQVTSCIDGVAADYGRLDALVNNAGAAHLGTLEMVDLESIRQCVEVNLMGVITTTKAALPHLRATGGRVMTITSVGGVVGQPFNEAYCAAKFGVEGFMQALAPVAETVGVGVAVIEPGAIASEFVNNLGLDVPAELAKAGPYTDAMQAYIQRTVAQFSDSRAQSPDDIARQIIETLKMNPMPFRQQTTEWARDFSATSLADLDGSVVLGMTRGWVSSTEEAPA